MRHFLPFALLLLGVGAAIANNNCTDVLAELRDARKNDLEQIWRALVRVTEELVGMIDLQRKEFNEARSERLDTHFLIDEMAEHIIALREKVEAVEKKLLFAEGVMHGAVSSFFSGSTAINSFMASAEERYRDYVTERILEKAATRGEEYLRNQTQKLRAG